jgi:hypothetical protein
MGEWLRNNKLRLATDVGLIGGAASVISLCIIVGVPADYVHVALVSVHGVVLLSCLTIMIVALIKWDRAGQLCNQLRKKNTKLESDVSRHLDTIQLNTARGTSLFEMVRKLLNQSGELHHQLRAATSAGDTSVYGVKIDAFMIGFVNSAKQKLDTMLGASCCVSIKFFKDERTVFTKYQDAGSGTADYSDVMSVSVNTSFNQIVHLQRPYFLCNDLMAPASNFNSTNSGLGSRYKSLLVVPLGKRRSQLTDAMDYYGFLCIGCSEPNRFDENRDPNVAGIFAEIIYDVVMHCVDAGHQFTKNGRCAAGGER